MKLKVQIKYIVSKTLSKQSENVHQAWVYHSFMQV